MRVVNIGTYPDDPTADDANVAFEKINDAFQSMQEAITKDSNLIGAANGIAPLGTNSKIPSVYLPSIARTIAATGDATWSVSLDGSANVSAALTLANSGVKADTLS